MKRNISDLLDSYVEDRVELNGGTPLSSERIKELTMSKIMKKKSNSYCKSVRFLVAAALVAALSASALAAGTVLGAGTLMQNFFTKGEKELTSGQIEALDQIGKTFEGGVTSNGATITPIAALADETVYYLRLRIEAPEGVALPDLDPDVDGYYQLSGRQYPEEWITVEPEEGAYQNGLSCSSSVEWLPDSDPGDNVKEAVLRLTMPEGTAEYEAKFNDGVSKLLTIHGLWVQDPYKEYTPVFTGEFAFDIGLHYDSQIIRLDCGGAAYQEPVYGFTNYLDRVTLSPLSIVCEFRTNLLDNPAIAPGSAGPLVIVLKDGTRLFEEEVEEN